MLVIVFVLTLTGTIFASIDYSIVYDADGMGYDAANGKYKVKLQVKSNAGDIPVGSFNLRILYNNACLNYNISESYCMGPIDDHEFFGIDVYSLIPVQMSSYKCGLNGVYDGSASSPVMCYFLDNTWTDCIVLVFDVADAAQNTNLRWDITGVQNAITQYDASPVTNGTFYGDHDVVLSGSAPVAPIYGSLFFSEISDNLAGQVGTTAFIEVKNVTDDEVDLTNVTVEKVTTAISVSLSGTVEPDGAIIISNGADQATFEAAWGITLDMSTTVFIQGDLQLGIGDGYSYSLNIPDAREVIDTTPVVNNDERYLHLNPSTWTSPTTPDIATPGSDGSLPVEFAGFNVAVDANQFVNITWSTKSEADLIGFRLFRSLNTDITDATPINSNQLIAATNTSVTQEYQYCDEEVALDKTYYYWIEVVQADNNTGGFHGPQSITIDKAAPKFVEATQLSTNYPNPFNPETKIEFSLKGQIGETVNASLVIYNIKGQKVVTLFDKREVIENDSVIWKGKDASGNNVSSGVYFYKLVTPEYTKTSKMVLMK